MGLIDRQAAIEVIDAVFPVDAMKSEYAQGIACGAALAKTYVTQLPSAQSEIAKDINVPNNDTISRQAAIDALRRAEALTRAFGYHDVIDTIRELPSAQQWIPCSERLPEANGRYLVTRGLNACGALWNRVYIANYSDLMGIKSEKIWWQGNVGKSDFERLDDVVSWMLLPEPYAER